MTTRAAPRRLLVSGVGLCFFLAFLSALGQVSGLIGPSGIVPFGNAGWPRRAFRRPSKVGPWCGLGAARLPDGSGQRLLAFSVGRPSQRGRAAAASACARWALAKVGHFPAPAAVATGPAASVPTGGGQWGGEAAESGRHLAQPQRAALPLL